jgi:hypothetical protein
MTSKSMRFALAFAVAASLSPAFADSTFPLAGLLDSLAGNPPDGWSRNMDGSYKQAASGVLCPKTFKSFTFKSIEGPAKDNPDQLGTCLYSGPAGRVGSVRIRRYAAGGDGSVSANDRSLMATDGTAPPLLMHAGIDRKNGGGRVTATVVRNGLLVDCSVWQPEHSAPKSDFLLYCTTLP